jgi:hypothetical protein
MRRGTHTIVAMAMVSKLMSRQQKLLDDWATSADGKSVLEHGHVSYDDLPTTLKAALERIKLSETVETDTERYLDDIVMKQRYGAKTAKELTGKQFVGVNGHAMMMMMIADSGGVGGVLLDMANLYQQAGLVEIAEVLIKAGKKIKTLKGG